MKMKHIRFYILSVFILVVTSSNTTYASKYHIESQDDFDLLKTQKFSPGDQILFKCGSVFTGMFSPSGHGTAKEPIVISTYGTGNRPLINAQGNNEAGLYLQNISYWEINGLEITNPYKNIGPERRMKNKPQGDILAEKKLFGILIRLNKEEKVYKHIYINNCYIHDVNDMVGEKDHGGIYVFMTDLKESRVDDLRITNNHIVNVGGVGIANYSECGLVESTGKGMEDYVLHNLWTNVYVADNIVDTTGRNNIIGRVSRDAIYERNVLANSSRAATGHAIFCFNTYRIKIQYNEAYGNTGKGIDRGGYDADYNCVDTYIQYNYSHNNEWFCGIMRKRNKGVYIRYNVSQNEGKGFVHYGFNAATQAQGIHIYNNTHYVKTNNLREIIEGNAGGIRTTFKNNIFFYDGKKVSVPGGTGNEIDVVFNNNVYYNMAVLPKDDNAKTKNPKFKNPGGTGTNIDLKTMKALSGYRLKKDSPYLDGATKIDENGGVNIFKEKLSKYKSSYGAL
jgi:hypothetical protein